MNACDVVGYVYDGACYCDGCKPDAPDDEVGVMFADGIDESTGATCDTCGACLVDMGDACAPSWEILGTRDAAGTYATTETGRATRWATCNRCNASRPHYKPDARTRLRALCGDASCPSCATGRLHF